MGGYVTDHQANKALVLSFYDDLDQAEGDALAGVLSDYVADGYGFRGMHPFYEQRGAAAVAEVFWRPFRSAIKPIQRRQDIFLAGTSDVDGSDWVCSMGHLMGLFDEEWLGIQPTRKMTFLRYADFNRVEDGKIKETGLFCDIIGVMQQAGVDPLPMQTGAALLTPGPQTHDGLLFDEQDPEVGQQTLRLVNQMLDDLTGSGLHSPQDELARTWHPDMIWFGPAGIGATYTMERYEEQHQGPFQSGLDQIEFHGHECRFAEGNYAAWFGWSNLTMVPSGGFMGLPASDRKVEMRVVDIYRRSSDKLAENWIFIDLPHFLSMQGLDVLERNRALNAASNSH